MKIGLVIFFLGIFQFVSAQPNYPVIESHILDTVPEGYNSEGYVSFRNNGKESVNITWVTASTDDFMPEYCRSPILPGDTGRVAFVFSTLRRRGSHDRGILIQLSNDSSIVHLVHYYSKYSDEEHFVRDTTFEKLLSNDSGYQFEIVRIHACQKTEIVSTGLSNPVKPDSSKQMISHTENGALPANRTSSVVAFKPQRSIDTCRCNIGMPVFPGGEKLFADSVLKITYMKIKPAKSGTCYVQFDIDTAGRIINPVVLRSVDSTFEKILLKNLNQAGRWVPVCEPESYLYDDAMTGQDLQYDENGHSFFRTVSVRVTCPFHLLVN